LGWGSDPARAAADRSRSLSSLSKSVLAQVMAQTSKDTARHATEFRAGKRRRLIMGTRMQPSASPKCLIVTLPLELITEVGAMRCSRVSRESARMNDVLVTVDSNITLMERPVESRSSFSLVPQYLYVQVCRFDLGNSLQKRSSKTSPGGANRIICLRTCKALIQSDRVFCMVACRRATSYSLFNAFPCRFQKTGL
jgi:hypothetical protein